MQQRLSLRPYYLSIHIFFTCQVCHWLSAYIRSSRAEAIISLPLDSKSPPSDSTPFPTGDSKSPPPKSAPSASSPVAPKSRVPSIDPQTSNLLASLFYKYFGSSSSWRPVATFSADVYLGMLARHPPVIANLSYTWGRQPTFGGLYSHPSP